MSIMNAAAHPTNAKKENANWKFMSSVGLSDKHTIMNTHNPLKIQLKMPTNFDKSSNMFDAVLIVSILMDEDISTVKVKSFCYRVATNAMIRLWFIA